MITKLFNFSDPQLDLQIEEIVNSSAAALIYTTLANDTTAMDFANNRMVQLTVTGAKTLTTTIAPVGTLCYLFVVSNAGPSENITFGTGFLTTGVLATEIVTSRKVLLTFVSNGTAMVEVCRTTALS